MHGDWPIETVGQDRFVGCSKVAAPLERLALVVEHLDCIVVADAWERLDDLLELRDVAIELRQFEPPAIEHSGDDGDDEVFGMSRSSSTNLETSRATSSCSALGSAVAR